MGTKPLPTNSRSKFITIKVDGKDIRPMEAWWVIRDPKGEPVKAFASDIQLKDDLARAARVAWSGDTAAILALNEGYRIELVTQTRFLKTIAPHLPETD